MVETLEAFKFVPVADLKSRKVSALSYWYDRTNDAMNVYVGTYKGEVVWFQFSLPSQSESSVASGGTPGSLSSHLDGLSWLPNHEVVGASLNVSEHGCRVAVACNKEAFFLCADEHYVVSFRV